MIREMNAATILTGAQIFNICDHQDLEVRVAWGEWMGYYNRISGIRAHTRLPAMTLQQQQDFRLANEANMQNKPDAPSLWKDAQELKESMPNTLSKPAPKVAHKTAPAIPKAIPQPEGRRGRPLTNAEKKITLVMKKNPKRPGTAGFDRYGLYKTGITVRAYVKAGGLPSDIPWDAQRGFITLR